MDIEDNAEALRLREGLSLIVARLGRVLTLFADQMETHAATRTVGFTHIQPAEPTTVGYRMAFYAQDLLADYHDLTALADGVRGKGFKGAVGTMASYALLLEGTGVSPDEFEAQIMAKVGLEPFRVAHQTYPRRQDFAVVNALASVGLTAHKFAFDLRLLQSPVFGEWAEPFGAKQIGSSAMPFKRNPINSENIDSLARLLATLPRVMWDNAANSLLERTLDDSGNRRTVIPEAFLITDELLRRMERLLRGLVINVDVIERNFATYAPFAASERLLMAAAKAGGNRQELHEVIRGHSLTAWDALRRGEPNPLIDLLTTDATITQFVSEAEARSLMDAGDYVGVAPERSLALAGAIRGMVGS
jgi:adenylosuccinate lyase